jgi:hypothetical protein
MNLIFMACPIPYNQAAPQKCGKSSSLNLSRQRSSSLRYQGCCLVASQPLSKLLAQESGASKRRCQDYSPPPVSARVLTLTADYPPTFHHSSPKPPHCVQTTRKPGQVSSGHTLECAASVSGKTKQKKTRLPIDKRYTAAQARESCRTIPIFGA